jgi:hypothetical protein
VELVVEQSLRRESREERVCLGHVLEYLFLLLQSRSEMAGLEVSNLSTLMYITPLMVQSS